MNLGGDGKNQDEGFFAINFQSLIFREKMDFNVRNRSEIDKNG